jgi:hypothetical protein
VLEMGSSHAASPGYLTYPPIRRTASPLYSACIHVFLQSLVSPALVFPRPEYTSLRLTLACDFDFHTLLCTTTTPPMPASSTVCTRPPRGRACGWGRWCPWCRRGPRRGRCGRGRNRGESRKERRRRGSNCRIRIQRGLRILHPLFSSQVHLTRFLCSSAVALMGVQCAIRTIESSGSCCELQCTCSYEYQ